VRSLADLDSAQEDLRQERERTAQVQADGEQQMNELREENARDQAELTAKLVTKSVELEKMRQEALKERRDAELLRAEACHQGPVQAEAEGNGNADRELAVRARAEAAKAQFEHGRSEVALAELRQEIAEMAQAEQRRKEQAAAELRQAEAERSADRELLARAQAESRQCELEVEAFRKAKAQSMADREFLAKAEAETKQYQQEVAALRKAHADELERTVANCAETLAGSNSQADGAQRKVRELERRQLEIDEQWRRRLAHVQEDLDAAREELRSERDCLVKAQADGERAVLRTIEGFWKAQVGTAVCM